MNSVAGKYDLVNLNPPDGDGVCDIELYSDGTYNNYNYTYPTNGDFEEREWKIENDNMFMRQWNEVWESDGNGGETFVGWEFEPWEESSLEIQNDYLILNGTSKWIKL